VLVDGLPRLVVGLAMGLLLEYPGGLAVFRLPASAGPHRPADGGHHRHVRHPRHRLVLLPRVRPEPVVVPGIELLIAAERLWALLGVVDLTSIVVHGTTASPVMDAVERWERTGSVAES
jgi:hypothetical protein